MFPISNGRRESGSSMAADEEEATQVSLFSEGKKTLRFVVALFGKVCREKKRRNNHNNNLGLCVCGGERERGESR